jgi:hypothetical protein
LRHDAGSGDGDGGEEREVEMHIGWLERSYCFGAEDDVDAEMC